MRVRRADVRAEQLRREEKARPPLDLLAFQRVVAVAGPDPVGPLEDLEVDPPTPAGAALDLDAGVPAADLVEQRVQGLGVAVDRRPAPGALSAVDDVAVEVPLEVLDRVLREQGVEALEEVRPGIRVTEVEQLLEPRQWRLSATGRQDPVRVRAGEVGVRVHRLRLDPQAELHPQPAHVVDEPAQSLRPDVGVDEPVPEPRLLVPAPPEPAVVEDEPLRPDLRRPVGERHQLRGVGVEVDRLPRVEDDRSRRARVAGTRTEEVVDAPRQLVESGRAVGADEPRARVRLARRQAHLSGQQQLSPAEDGVRPGREALRVHAVVSAPGDVHSPHLARPEAEPARARDEQQRRVVATFSPPALPQPRADVERLPLWCALPDVPPGEVEHLVRDRWNRQGDVDGVDAVGLGGMRVRQPRPGANQPGGRQLQPDLDLKGRRLVDALDDDPRRVDVADALHAGHGEQGRPVPAVAVAADAGPPRVSERVLRQDRRRDRVVHDVRRHLRDGDHRQLSQGLLGQVPEVRAPVEDARQPRGGVRWPPRG